MAFGISPDKLAISPAETAAAQEQRQARKFDNQIALQKLAIEKGYLALAKKKGSGGGGRYSPTTTSTRSQKAKDAEAKKTKEADDEKTRQQKLEDDVLKRKLDWEDKQIELDYKTGLDLIKEQVKASTTPPKKEELFAQDFANRISSGEFKDKIAVQVKADEMKIPLSTPVIQEALIQKFEIEPAAKEAERQRIAVLRQNVQIAVDNGVPVKTVLIAKKFGVDLQTVTQRKPIVRTRTADKKKYIYNYDTDSMDEVIQ